MMANSLIRKSGQLWKFVLAVALLLIGSFAPLAKSIGMSWTAGTIVALVGYVFALAFIMCPACNSRWLWKAMLNAELYAPLFKKPQCPTCKHDYSSR